MQTSSVKILRKVKMNKVKFEKRHTKCLTNVFSELKLSEEKRYALYGIARPSIYTVFAFKNKGNFN